MFLSILCDWAVRHLEQFPVEINRAGYYTLLKVPGIGTNSASVLLMRVRVRDSILKIYVRWALCLSVQCISLHVRAG